MEILRRAQQGANKFRVVRSFMRGTKPVAPGDLIEMKDPEASEEFALARVEPTDIPPTGIYIALRPFALPGPIKKFECKAGDLVEIKEKDATELLRDGKIIPQNSSQWRPWNRKVRTTAGNFAKRCAELDEAIRDRKFEEEMSFYRPSRK